MSLKLIAFLTIYLSFANGLKENVVFNIPELNENQLKWPQQKIQTIEYLLNALTEVGNVTLVGWQRIYDIDGSLKEIRTIELTILIEAHREQSLDVESVAVYVEFEVLEEVLNESATLTGITWSGSFHQWNRDGSLTDAIEIQSNNIKVYNDFYEVMDWKRIATVTNLESVNSFVKKLERQSPLPVTVLHWDVDGKFNVRRSNVVPMHLATVASTARELSMAHLESAVKAVSKGITLFNDKLYSYVANYMTKKFPDYLWLVSSSVSGSWLNYDAHLIVHYETDVFYSSTMNIHGYKL